jgi:hypothetical protein
MGRLAGFPYREIARKLKRCGFEFDRQAAVVSAFRGIESDQKLRGEPRLEFCVKLKQFVS